MYALKLYILTIDKPLELIRILTVCKLVHHFGW